MPDGISAIQHTVFDECGHWSVVHHNNIGNMTSPNVFIECVTQINSNLKFVTAVCLELMGEALKNSLNDVAPQISILSARTVVAMQAKPMARIKP